MKKHYFIYLFFLCLIATSCESTVFEEEIPVTSATTRSSYEDLGYYGSYFVEQMYGTDEAFGYIRFNPPGAEYSFSYGTFATQPNLIKSSVSIIGGNIIYKGHDVGNKIDGVPNEVIRFTVKFNGTMAKVTINLNASTVVVPDNETFGVRLVIDNKNFDGKYLPTPPVDAGIGDFIFGKLR